MTMRYRLLALLIVLALGPPVLAAYWLFTFDMSAREKLVAATTLVAGFFWQHL